MIAATAAGDQQVRSDCGSPLARGGRGPVDLVGLHRTFARQSQTALAVGSQVEALVITLASHADAAGPRFPENAAGPWRRTLPLLLPPRGARRAFPGQHLQRQSTRVGCVLRTSPKKYGLETVLGHRMAVEQLWSCTRQLCSAARVPAAPGPTYRKTLICLHATQAASKLCALTGHLALIRDDSSTGAIAALWKESRSFRLGRSSSWQPAGGRGLHPKAAHACSRGNAEGECGWSQRPSRVEDAFYYPAAAGLRVDGRALAQYGVRGRAPRGTDLARALDDRC